MIDSDNEAEAETSKEMARVLAAGATIKTLGGWAFGLVMIVISIIFWVQSQGSDKYYPKLAGENLEKQLSRMEQKFDNLEAGNLEIIRLLGRLEANQDRNDK